jgi:hypothetical protein
MRAIAARTSLQWERKSNAAPVARVGTRLARLPRRFQAERSGTASGKR